MAYTYEEVEAKSQDIEDKIDFDKPLHQGEKRFRAYLMTAGGCRAKEVMVDEGVQTEGFRTG